MKVEHNERRIYPDRVERYQDVLDCKMTQEIDVSIHYITLSSGQVNRFRRMREHLGGCMALLGTLFHHPSVSHGYHLLASVSNCG